LADENSEGIPKCNEGVYDKYEVVKKGDKNYTLGKGSYGEVILMKEKATGNLVALKIIQKGAVENPKALQYLVNEIEIQKRIIHENIIRLYSYYEDSKNLYIIMEYAKKGSLFQLVRRKRKLSEKEAFFFFTQVCSAIYFLHTHDFIHRDIKPENLLIMESGTLKLCDFGCCTKSNTGDRMTFCGTAEYMAPEIIKRDGYREKADVWSLGILLYEMLHGYAPYHGRKDQEIFGRIIDNKPVFRNIKEDSKDLIKSLINQDPSVRPEIWEIFMHPWMKRMQQEFGIKEQKTPLHEQHTANKPITDKSKGPIAKFLLYNPKKQSEPQSNPNEQPNNSETTQNVSPVRDESKLPTIQETQQLKIESHPLHDVRAENKENEEQIDVTLKESRTKTEADREKAFDTYDTKKPKRETKVQPDKDNMFHVPNRCSTWKNTGLPTFKLDLEVDPLFHVNKFLDEIGQKNVQNSGKVLHKLQTKFNNTPHSKASTEADLNASYTSEDYASQRSEIVLKAVDYLDDLDANPTKGCTDRIKKEIATENRRLKKMNANLDRLKKEMKKKEKEAKEKEAKPLMCPKPTDSGPVDEKAETEETNLSADNSEYQESIKNIMKTLLNVKTESNTQTCSSIVNKARAEKNEKVREKESLWNGLLALIKRT
jgi:serine/threonine protein kinase